MTEPSASRDRSTDTKERWAILHDLEKWLQTPMVLLSFTWLVLVVAEIVWGSTRLLEVFGTIIWIIFILEFALRLRLAPDKTDFLRRNWITVIALVAPAFRMAQVLRFLHAARVARGLRLMHVVGTANRGMNALRASLGRRGLGYVLGVTVLMTFLGAAGMLAFEPAAEVEGGFQSYGDALWWTAMLLTSIGSQYWPQTGEGRLLCFLLALYGFAVFGYITASFATFFIGQEAEVQESDAAASGDIVELKGEIARLRAELRAPRFHDLLLSECLGRRHGAYLHAAYRQLRPVSRRVRRGPRPAVPLRTGAKQGQSGRRHGPDQPGVPAKFPL